MTQAKNKCLAGGNPTFIFEISFYQYFPVFVSNLFFSSVFIYDYGAFTLYFSALHSRFSTIPLMLRHLRLKACQNFKCGVGGKFVA